MVATDNCMLSSIMGPYDIFTYANGYWREMDPSNREDLFLTEIVTMDGRSITSFNRAVLQPHKAMNDVDETDLILLPAIMEPVDQVLQKHQVLLDWLVRQHTRGRCLVSTCSGVFFLAEAGLLKGRTATTHWNCATAFQQKYTDVILKSEKIIIDEGDIICAGSATSYIDLSLYLIEKFGTLELAALCSKMLLIDPKRVSQAPYQIFKPQKNHHDEEILKAQILMERHYQDSISIDAIAAEVGLGTRNFKRRFKQATGDTPLAYLQRIRVEQAKRQLEMTRLPVNEITYHVGYEDQTSFRKLFKRYTTFSPSQYRDKFNKLAP